MGGNSPVSEREWNQGKRRGLFREREVGPHRQRVRTDRGEETCFSVLLVTAYACDSQSPRPNPAPPGVVNNVDGTKPLQFVCTVMTELSICIRDLPGCKA